MPDLAVNPRRVAPLPQAKVRNMIASDAGNVGDLVYVAPDFGVRVSDADAAATANAVGIVTAAGCEGATSFVAGDAVSVVVHGPVCGVTATAPGTLFVSNNAGKISDAAGATSRVIGRVEKADVIFINPVLV